MSGACETVGDCGHVDSLLAGAVRNRRTFVLGSDSELGLYFGDADAQVAFDFCDGLGLSEVAGVIEVLQVRLQLLEEFAREAVAHRIMILPQNRCRRLTILL
jgi:hypothetical protein